MFFLLWLIVESEIVLSSDLYFLESFVYVHSCIFFYKVKDVVVSKFELFALSPVEDLFFVEFEIIS